MLAPCQDDESDFPSTVDSHVFRLEEVPVHIRRHLDAKLQAYGLSRAQWRLLAYAFRQDGLTQTELARLLELERATVGQTIDALESKGLVRRKALPADRRVWAIHVTPKARALLPKLRQIGADMSAQLFRGFESDDFARLSILVDRMIANMTV